MKGVALGLLALILAKVAGAAVPTSAADEGKLMRSSDREPKHLQPRGNNPPFGNYDCIAEFGARRGRVIQSHLTVAELGSNAAPH